MTDGDDLFAAVLASPDEDLPRLVYADWLDENGQPERAEFIRVQIELERSMGNEKQGAASVVANVPPIRPEEFRKTRVYQLQPGDRGLSLLATETTLLGKYAGHWLEPLRLKNGPLYSNATHGQFRRGFVEVVWMPAIGFLTHAEHLFRLSPVRELRVTRTRPGDIVLLLTSDQVARLHTLDITDYGFGEAISTALTIGRSIAKVRVLRLRACGLTDEDAERLAKLPFDWPLQELDVSYNRIGPFGLEQLVKRFGPAVHMNGPVE
jgi:uncharacterized protein (TIGR02996 family)